MLDSVKKRKITAHFLFATEIVSPHPYKYTMSLTVVTITKEIKYRKQSNSKIDVGKPVKEKVTYM